MFFKAASSLQSFFSMNFRFNLNLFLLEVTYIVMVNCFFEPRSAGWPRISEGMKPRGDALVCVTIHRWKASNVHRMTTYITREFTSEQA
jgi:hypothetical protein